MAKKYNLRKIVSKRSYTTEEAAELLGIHTQTVRVWHKAGMQAIDETSSPFLFLGSDIKNFLAAKLARKKVKLLPNEFYCLKCRVGVIPKKVYIVDRGVTIGANKQSIFVIGHCPECNLEVRKFGTKEQKNQSINKLKKTRKVVEGNQEDKYKDEQKDQMSLL